MSTSSGASPDDSRILFGGNTGVIGADLSVAWARRCARSCGACCRSSAMLRWPIAGPGDAPERAISIRMSASRSGIHYAVGYCFAGVPMGTHFGLTLARRLLGRGDAQSVFWQRPFEAIPLYRGNPWFVPYAMRWYARHDWR